MKKLEEFYTKSQNKIQKKLSGEKVAEALRKNRVYKKLKIKHKLLIKRSNFLVISSSEKGKYPDCSIKCGLPGFVKVINFTTLRWEDLDGNRMYRTLGNIAGNNKVSLLFVDFEKPEKKEKTVKPTKLRILGISNIMHIKGKRFINIKISYVFPNCPRYLPNFKFISPSSYLLRKKIPIWKKRSYIKKLL